MGSFYNVGLKTHDSVKNCLLIYRKTTDLQPWARAVCTLPALPSSTQPSTLRGMVNEYQLSNYLSNNNKWRQWL